MILFDNKRRSLWGSNHVQFHEVMECDLKILSEKNSSMVHVKTGYYFPAYQRADLYKGENYQDCCMKKVFRDLAPERCKNCSFIVSSKRRGTVYNKYQHLRKSK